MRVMVRRGRFSRWIYLIGAAILLVILLFWLEWLGSEQPLMKVEVPVMQPVAKQKTGSHVEK